MSRKLILASTMTMILAGSEVSALGLGGLRTYSVLNQPFSGEIELSDVRADELDAVKAGVASSEAFSKAGIERYHYLTRLNFTPEVSAQGRPVIRVSSREPIREPYVDVLVEVVWPSGKTMKEYTVLLDPPVTSGRRTATVNVPRAGGGRAGGYIAAPGGGAPVSVASVPYGLGLWQVARQNAPAGATVAQTAMALYRNNQHAFVRGNINKLVAGASLVVPTKEELYALDAAAAQREFGAALRGRAVHRAPITDVSSASRLRIAGSASSPSPSRAVSPPAAPMPVGLPPAPGVEKDVMLALETSESTRQETVELRSRIKDLEKQLSDIQGLLQLRNAELSRLQEDAGTPGVVATADAEQMSTLPEGDAASTTPNDETGLPEPLATATPGDDASVTPAVPEETSEAASETVVSEVTEVTPGSETQTPATAGPGLMPLPAPVEPQAIEPAAPVTPPPVPVKPAPPPVAEEPSTWHSLLLPIAGFAGLTALGILVFSWISARRRREGEKQVVGLETAVPQNFQEASTQTHTSRLRDEVTTPREVSSSLDSLQSRDDADDVESPVSMMSSLSNFDAETDEADVLSEADIYIAYGRHSEARELLLTELNRFPSRIDIKFKLGEAYAGAKDVEALRALLSDIEAAGGDRSDPGQWRRLQELLQRTEAVTADSGHPSTASVGSLGAAAGGAVADDSLDLGAEDSFSLDISDIQQTTSTGSLSGVTLEPSLSLEDTPEGLLAKNDLVKGDSLLGELSDGPDLGDLESERDSFGLANTVNAGDRSTTPPPEGELDVEDSDIDLDLEDQRIDVVDDLDSIFDSSVAEEPTLARNEMTGGRPSLDDVLAQSGARRGDSSEASLPPDQESVPTDLLSSQWQMDSGIWDETATKLDLARAYIEMDDGDAAREILEEVVNEGRDEQREEAEELLKKLS